MATDTKPEHPAILFTDWDGTVTLQDSNDMLTDNLGMGYDARMVLDAGIRDGSLTFREAFEKMLSSVSDKGYPLDKCIDYLLQNVKLDPGFKETVQWCHSMNIPVIVVSSGMDVVIKSLLENLITEPELRSFIKIYANHVDVDESTGKWKIRYRDDSGFGHDKNQTILNVTADPLHSSYAEGKRFYCGDGVSDISASRSCDLLFAKKGCALVEICKKDGINYDEFESFKTILDHIKNSV